MRSYSEQNIDIEGVFEQTLSENNVLYEQNQNNLNYVCTYSHRYVKIADFKRTPLK